MAFVFFLIKKKASGPFKSGVRSYYFYSKLQRRSWSEIPPMRRLGPRARVALRVAAAVIGGYAWTASWVALLAALLPVAGMARSEAVVLAAMLGYVIYLLVLLWAFSVRSMVRLGAVLIGGTALATGLVTLVRGGV